MAKWLGRNWIWTAALGTVALYVPLAGSATDERLRQRNLDVLSEVIATVQKHAVEAPTPRQTSSAAIQGMLRTLDPHSSFFTEEDYRQMREDQTGSFFGIGATIQQRPDGVVIMGFLPGGSAEKSGLLPGDYIKEVDGKSVEGQSSNQVVQKLRGEKGTVVKVGVQRVGHEKLLSFQLTRAFVPTSTIDHAFLIRPGVGMIRVKEFGVNTGKEFQEAVDRLKAQGMTALILDLRFNPGGVLDAAVAMCRTLLGPDEVIVTQKGRNGQEQGEQRTWKERPLDPFPLVVLVNRNSASASEIVAGAVQDHDRGLIAGTTSWGKGLVQTSYIIGRTRGLHITTARYYTPSGRLIQREYKNGIDEYINVDDSLEKEEPKGPVFKTDLGRPVYGGGGITPDVRIEAERFSLFTSRILRVGLIFRFALQERDRIQLASGDNVPQASMDRFKAFLQEQKFPFTEEEWKEEKNQKELRDQISYELQGLIHGTEAGYRHLANRDTQLLKALELLPQAEQLLQRWLAAQKAKPAEVKATS